MAWLYVPGLAASNSGSPPPCPDTAPPVTWRGKDMPPRSWRREWKRGTFRPLQFTLTSDPSTVDRGVESWISSLRATRANPSASQGREQEPTTRATSGQRFTGSFARFDRDLYSWKMSQATFQWDSGTFSGTWPQQGLMRSGACFRRRKSELHTSGRGFSSWLLPTPAAQSYGTNKGGSAGRVGKERPSLETMARRAGGLLSPQFAEVLMGFPIGWTGFAHLATPSSLPRPRTPGES